jgi:photosystem II stability/assembly factor-like uncharacterized protein
MKQNQIVRYAVLGAVALSLAGGLFAIRSFATEAKTVASLTTETHFHGISVDANDPSRLYLATHHGLFVVDATGKARLLSQTRDDFMGFTPHPADPSVLYASGHPSGGGNLGFTASDDGGRSWRKLSDGAGGPVDFHQLDVSKADPDVIYGVYGDIQKSRDGGQSWIQIGPAPEGLIDLAAGHLPDTLYAATEQGLLRTTDDGKSWKPAYVSSQPATMVEVTSGGEIYAFVVGTGLVQAEEQGLNWRGTGDGFGGQYVIHFAVAPTDDRRLYAVTFNPVDRTQSLLASADGGESWSALSKE